MSRAAKLSAIPTVYRGARFRSRLEAKWAAMFDRFGWPWSYEPIDLAGYVPDFVLRFNKPLLVEVKPAFHLKELKAAAQKIERSGWNGDALVVGADPLLLGSWSEDTFDGGSGCGGLLSDRGWGYGDDSWWWGPGLWFRCRECGQPSIRHEEASYHCRVRGCGDGDHHLGELADVELQWRIAGSETQWHRP